ncbi:MAG: DUF1385 domain-containing protein [Anaerolineaceae bacterium]
MPEQQRLPNYGGQALIEGVLMRGSKSLAAAFRKPDGEIVIRTEKLSGIYTGNLKNIPLLRGLIALWDSLGLGLRYLTYSANYQTGEEDQKIEGPTMYLTFIVSIAIAVGLFFLLPALIGHWTDALFNWSSWIGNLVEGIVRLIFLILYIWGVGKMSDIHRVFQYHGAEHKTINAFESHMELTPENLKPVSTQHPRCGTAFLLTLVILSIIIFTLLGPMTVVWRLLSRIILLPVMVGLAYEFIRWTAGHLHNPIVWWLVKPNLALQRLTTAEPDEKMLEVSIAAFNAMLKEEENLQTM